MGVVLNLIGAGLTGFVYRTVFAQTGRAAAVATLEPIQIPVLGSIPFLGNVFFNQNILVYATYFLVPLAAYVLFKTNFGLALRAVGEHPRAVASVGLNVNLLRYVPVVVGALLAGIGGSYLSIAHANQFVEGLTAGRGFIAVAMVPLGAWNPIFVGLAGLLFGGAFALQLRLQAGLHSVAYQFLQILPYVVTFVALILAHRESAQPNALAVPYEEG
jgi:simple sugar transport system permease protein